MGSGPEPVGPRRSRREVIRRGAAGAFAAGLVWSAPRIEGLSLRPDYAAAQTTGGASFDLTGSSAGHSFASFDGSVHSPVAGVDRLFLIFFMSGSLATWTAQIRGPAVGTNCNITGFDGSENWAGISPTPPFDAPAAISDSPGVQTARRSASADAVSDSGSTTFTVHVTCT